MDSPETSEDEEDSEHVEGGLSQLKIGGKFNRASNEDDAGTLSDGSGNSDTTEVPTDVVPCQPEDDDPDNRCLTPKEAKEVVTRLSNLSVELDSVLFGSVNAAARATPMYELRLFPNTRTLKILWTQVDEPAADYMLQISFHAIAGLEVTVNLAGRVQVQLDLVKVPKFAMRSHSGKTWDTHAQDFSRNSCATKMERLKLVLSEKNSVAGPKPILSMFSQCPRLTTLLESSIPCEPIYPREHLVSNSQRITDANRVASTGKGLWPVGLGGGTNCLSVIDAIQNQKVFDFENAFTSVPFTTTIADALRVTNFIVLPPRYFPNFLRKIISVTCRKI